MRPEFEHGGVASYLGDNREIMRQLPEKCAQTCVTSPPYFGLRDYGTDGQIGLEATPEAYVAAMVEVFREVWRVLKDDGTLWLNLGDTYAGGGGYAPNAPSNQKGGSGLASTRPSIPASKISGGFKPSGQIKQKDLLGIPWRVAFALQSDGWYLRSDIIWSKPNPMPESVTDRPTKAHEYMFLLSKSPKYFYDAEAVKEPVTESTIARLSQDLESQNGSDRVPGKTNGNMKAVGKGNARTFRGGGAYTGNRAFDNGAAVERESHGNAPNETGLRNRRTVWTVATQPCTEAHFATFPPELIRPCILAGSRVGDVVLDPFGGSGTTALVARQERRKAILIDLNPDYLEIQKRRLNVAQGVMELEAA